MIPPRVAANADRLKVRRRTARELLFQRQANLPMVTGDVMIGIRKVDAVRVATSRSWQTCFSSSRLVLLLPSPFTPCSRLRLFPAALVFFGVAFYSLCRHLVPFTSVAHVLKECGTTPNYAKKQNNGEEYAVGLCEQTHRQL